MHKIEEINLLYIEDDESISNLMTGYLNRPKYPTKFNTTVKNTLKRGLRYLKDNCSKGRIDAILLDLVLPNSKGVNTFKAVSEICNFLPIIIISGYEDIACECVKLGAQDYLIKPDITSKLLIRSIKYAIERKKAKEYLNQEKEKFKELVEVTRASIYEIDFIKNRFVYVNNFLCKQVGYSKEELMEIDPEKILTQKSINEWYKRMEDLNKGKKISTSTEYEVVKKDGSTGWVLITANFLRNKQNIITGAKVVAINITDKKEMELILQEKEKEVFSILESKIKIWKKEMIVKEIKTGEKLQLINREILSLNTISI